MSARYPYPEMRLFSCSLRRLVQGRRSIQTAALQALTREYQESETNTIKLDDDAPRSVEMLLLYLYTLAVPDFKDKQFGGQWTAAEAAYKTGDRYGVPGLRDAGHSFMLSLINKDLATWHKSTDANQSSWIIRITRVWQWDNESAQDLRVAMIKSLVICSIAIIEDESFRQLLKDKEDFALAFLRAFTKEANRH